ncbi:MAG TPA: hypothetical protein DCZ48_14320 [Methylococcaceae bacterium]|nr:hypothetical protein [Methylococcaceae bacterium]
MDPHGFHIHSRYIKSFDNGGNSFFELFGEVLLRFSHLSKILSNRLDEIDSAHQILSNRLRLASIPMKPSFSSQT